jgi:hypothetical protein
LYVCSTHQLLEQLHVFNKRNAPYKPCSSSPRTLS